jgi:hypothetical protein
MQPAIPHRNAGRQVIAEAHGCLLSRRWAIGDLLLVPTLLILVRQMLCGKSLSTQIALGLLALSVPLELVRQTSPGGSDLTIFHCVPLRCTGWLSLSSSSLRPRRCRGIAPGCYVARIWWPSLGASNLRPQTTLNSDRCLVCRARHRRQCVLSIFPVSPTRRN